MQLPPFKPGYEPRFQPGQVVWLSGGRKNSKPFRETIHSVQFELVPDEKGGAFLATTGYRLGTFNPHRRDYYYSDSDLYATEGEAAIAGGWHAVKNASLEDWEKALSDLADEGLGVGIKALMHHTGLTTVDKALDLLFQCQKHGGLIQHDREVLKELLSEHAEGYGYNPKRHIILTQILAELGITIDERPAPSR